MKKKLLFVLTALLTSTMSAWADDGDVFTAKTVEDVEMTFKVISEAEKTCQVGGGTSSQRAIDSEIEEDITIPAVVNGYSVTKISNYAFYQCKYVTSITIPAGVTSIGNSAFYQCKKITSITLPDGVTSIGSSAFYGCSGLTSISIPKDVTKIEKSTFYGCSGLTSITLPDGVTSIGGSAFYGCKKITSITLPNGVTSIGNSTFYGCTGLTSITIPKDVTKIEGSTFYGCSGLTSITIPTGITSIGTSAFYGCSGLTSIKLPSSVNTIGESAFYGCSGLESISIPEGVKSLRTKVFQGCSSLTNVTIPSSVTAIESYAFYGCSGLTSITIPNSVTAIGASAFASCSGLTSIMIGNSVTSIGNYAFAGCSGLTSVISLIEEPFEVDNDCFRDYYGYKALLYVPIGTKEKYEATNGWNFIKIEEFSDASITLAKDMETFTYGMALDFSTPVSGLKAYVVKEVNDGKAVLSEVKGIVPPATGLVLKGTAGQSYTIPYSTSTPVVENKLVGVLADTKISGNDKNYILQDGKFVKAKSGTLKAGKAYLKLDAALAREVIEIDGEVTGISSVNGEGFMVNGYYNLNGQRISQPTKGLYIKNGKKVYKN